ncbi:MSMEG_0570 family nitrogen starvation response protein [Saccharopolyspora soli]|uniref:MSMEG_0570 family nitrogen starvation response protein n=1 Tax=Saccharopolyspora soli TaxID=2926618 RepID=UPI001F58B812|nr:MSMEG_0570 family nitrogen starvation response protein [Saccharopolyspora soli]
MPEMYFRVRWPDGEIQRCYSPSTVIADYFEPGAVYSVADFVARSRQALGIASARVRARYGVACAAAADQLIEIETTAAAFTGQPEAPVTVEALLPASGSRR